MKLSRLPALFMAGLLAACGGGNGSNPTVSPPLNLAQEAGAPAFTGNTALDGFNWINYRRIQAGLPKLTENSLIDAAAQGHSNYQKINNTITHDEISSNSGFTGAQLVDRLNAAGYLLKGEYAAGEVIAAATDTSGFVLSEQLITAIYHRFVIFEPAFKEIGTGAATIAGGYTYFTADFAANNGYGPGLRRGNIVVYPVDKQTRVATSFSTNQETPDPVANQDLTGYPISVHANISAILNVSTFTVRPHGGSDLTVKMLISAQDPETPVSAAAIIPLAVLAASTTYDVAFSGSVDGVPVTRSWSFTTQ